VRVGVVGLGRMGSFYAETVAALGASTQLAAVVDGNAGVRDALKARLGVAHAYADVADALERANLDAVIVATSTSAHAAVVIAAANAGKPIFCEKPLAVTVEQTRKVLDVVQRSSVGKAIFCEKPLALTVAETEGVLERCEGTKVLLQIGFMRRFDAAHVRAREAIQAGNIGRPLSYKSVGRDPGCPPVAYADPQHSGGLIIDMGIHDFDMARWLMSSEVERVSAEGSLLVCDELRRVGDIDNAFVLLRFASGALGTVEVSRTARYGYDIQTEVLGSDGALRVGASSARGLEDAQLLPPQAASDDPTPPFVRRFAKAYRAQIEDFLACVRDDRPPRAGGADALAAIQIAEAATLAARGGQPVEVTARV
jgi:predicted dehydrogenase